MELAKRTEVELRDSLHDAIDRMSLIEIVVLIFLVQTIRTREFVSRILPKPQKELPEVATTCTDPRTDRERYFDMVRVSIQENLPYPPLPKMDEFGYVPVPALQEPTEEEWNRAMRGAPSYFSAPIPMPMYARDAYGRPRVAGVQPSHIPPEQATLYLDLGSLGGVNVPIPAGANDCIVDPRSYVIRWTLYDCSVVESHELQEYMTEHGIPGNAYAFSFPTLPVGYCTPSRNQITVGNGPVNAAWL